MSPSEKPDGYAGRVSLLWIPSSKIYLYALSFRHWQRGRFTPVFGSSTREGQIPDDEFLDRNLTRLVREVAQEVKDLQADTDSGQFSLWSPPGHHDPEMWSR